MDLIELVKIYRDKHCCVYISLVSKNSSQSCVNNIIKQSDV